MDKYIKFLHKNFPHLVESMKSCTHHYSSEYLNPYHLEGDVWTHSLLVGKMAEFYSADERLQLAALLHDLGKCFVRNDRTDNKVRFYGHSGVSFFEAIEILNQPELHLSNESKRYILEIIGLHSYLPNIQNNEKKIKEKFNRNRNLLRSLADFYYCDSNGRFTEVSNNFSQYLSVGEANNIFNRLNKYFVVKDKNYCNNEFIMLIGLPCSGKSTYAKENFTENYTIISRDDIVLEEGGTSNYNEAWVKADHKKVDSVFTERVQLSLKNNDNIVIDRTNLSSKSRNKVLCNVPDTYYKKAIVFCTSNDIITERDIQRENKFVPVSVRLDMMKSFTPPLYDKFDEIEYVF